MYIAVDYIEIHKSFEISTIYLVTMQKRLIHILCLIILSQSSVFARKSHKTHGGRIAHRTHKTTHKVHNTQPTVTLDDINTDENIWGIDVSHHQNDINWDNFGEKKPHFMFIKASEGVTIQDNKYSQNYIEAKKHGILVGSYHFFSYKTHGRDQANNFLSVAQHKSGDLLPVLDAEFSKEMPEKELVTSELSDFINTVYEQLGNYPIVYCNYKYYKLYIEGHLQDRCKLWIVDYKTKPDCEWTFWQKTDKFKLAGIRGFVDLNLFNGSVSKLKGLICQDISKK